MIDDAITLNEGAFERARDAFHSQYSHSYRTAVCAGALPREADLEAVRDGLEMFLFSYLLNR